MIELTKKEIRLCRQVAEKHRKSIKYGDWLLNEGGFVKVWPYRHNCKRIELIPLWTISDCLEFLKEKKWRFCGGNENNQKCIWWFAFTNSKQFPFDIHEEGKTVLEACLKVVLAALAKR